jgi:hypothetical protein
MALLTILLLVFAFVFAGFGSSSSGTGTAPQIKPVAKCSQRMPADKAPSTQERRRCGPPPANP